MSKIKIAEITLLIIIGLTALLFFTGTLNLTFTKWYTPKKENIRREVFEETKSYVHGQTQQLAKYYSEWQNAEIKDRAVIEELIKMQIADLDANNVSNVKLRNFLIKTRGY